MDNQPVGPPLTLSRRTRSLAGHSEVSLRSVFSLPVSNINIENKSSQSTLSKSSFGDDSGRMSLNPRHLAKKLSLFKPLKPSLRDILRDTEWTNRNNISNRHEELPVVRVLDTDRVKKLVAAIFLFIVILGVIIGTTTKKSGDRNGNLMNESNSTNKFNFTMPNTHPSRTHKNSDSSPIEPTKVPSTNLHMTVHPTSSPGKDTNSSNLSSKPVFAESPIISVTDATEFNETGHSLENSTKNGINILSKPLPVPPLLSTFTQVPTLYPSVTSNETIEPSSGKATQNPTLHPSIISPQTVEPLSGKPNQKPTMYPSKLTIESIETSGKSSQNSTSHPSVSSDAKMQPSSDEPSNVPTIYPSTLSYESVKPSLREASKTLTYHPSIFSNNTKRPTVSRLSITFTSAKDTSKPTNIEQSPVESKNIDSTILSNFSQTMSLSNLSISNKTSNNSNISKPLNSQSPSLPKVLFLSNTTVKPSLVNITASSFSIPPSLTPNAIISPTSSNYSIGAENSSLSPTLAASITYSPSTFFNNSVDDENSSFSPTIAFSTTNSPSTFPHNSVGAENSSFSPTLAASIIYSPSTFFYNSVDDENSSFSPTFAFSTTNSPSKSFSPTFLFLSKDSPSTSSNNSIGAENSISSPTPFPWTKASAVPSFGLFTNDSPSNSSNNSIDTENLSLSPAPTLMTTSSSFSSLTNIISLIPSNIAIGTENLSLSPTHTSSTTASPAANIVIEGSLTPSNNSEGAEFLSSSPTPASSTTDSLTGNSVVLQPSSILSSTLSSLSVQPSVVPITALPSLNVTMQPSAFPVSRWAQVGGDIFGSQDLERIGELTSISRKNTDSSSQIRIAISTSLNEYKYDTNLEKSLYPGIVQVFELQETNGDSSWAQLGSVFSGEKNFGLGSSMILSGDGNTLVLGSMGDFEASLQSYTAIFRYNESSTDEWEKIGNFESQEKNEVLCISNSITYDGNRLLLGMASYTQNGGEKIVIATFDFVKKNTWKLIGSPLVYDSSPSVPTDRNRSRITKQKLILSTSISNLGHRFAISAYGRYYTFAQVREFDERSMVWKPLMDPIPSRPGDISLSGDGQVFAIGIPKATPNKGQVRVYMVKRKGAWFQLGTNFNSPTNDFHDSDLQCQLFSDNFGHSISLSSTGYRIAIGSPIQCDSISVGVGNIGFRGQVFLYDYAIDSNKWELVGEEVSAKNTSDVGLFLGKEKGDRFGHSVSLSEDGEMMIVGALTSNIKGRERGKVQVYGYG